MLTTQLLDNNNTMRENTNGSTRINQNEPKEVVWKSPLYTIHPPHDSDNYPVTHPSTSSNTISITVPFAGYYGFIFGAERNKDSHNAQPPFECITLSSSSVSNDLVGISTTHHSSEYVQKMIQHPIPDSKLIIKDSHSENTKIINSNSNAAVTVHDNQTENQKHDNNSNDDNKNIKKKNKKEATQTNLSRLEQKLPIHCGCTFKAIFRYDGNMISNTLISNNESINHNNDHNDNNIDNTGDEVIIATLPLPARNNCLISTSSSTTPATATATAMKSSRDQILLTSTQIARMISLPSNTKISVEYCQSCDTSSSSLIICCCKQFSWKWGLILLYPPKKCNDNNDLVDGINHKHDHYLSHNHDTKDINSSKTDHKKARYVTEPILINHNLTEPHQPQTKSLTLKDDNLHSKIDLNPSRWYQKPFICIHCSRKFPSVTSAKQHIASTHTSTMMNEGMINKEQYYDLIGPPQFRVPLKVAYQDDDIVIVVKPQGMPVQGHKWTLCKSDLLTPFRCSPERDGALSKPRIAHRLDSATGGLLVCAKTIHAERALKDSFKQRSCKKRYRAIVFGKLEACKLFGDLEEQEHDSINNNNNRIEENIGVINYPVDSKPSLTQYEVISYSRTINEHADGWLTTVDLYPLTGRRHQLRKHLKMIGHPIWGDVRYGPYGNKAECNQNSFQTNNDDLLTIGDFKKNLTYKDTERLVIENPKIVESATAIDYPHFRLCLWALEITFPHPVKNNDSHVVACIDEPRWFEDLRVSQEANT